MFQLMRFGGPRVEAEGEGGGAAVALYDLRRDGDLQCVVPILSSLQSLMPTHCRPPTPATGRAPPLYSPLSKTRRPLSKTRHPLTIGSRKSYPGHTTTLRHASFTGPRLRASILGVELVGACAIGSTLATTPCGITCLEASRVN